MKVKIKYTDEPIEAKVVPETFFLHPKNLHFGRKE